MPLTASTPPGYVLRSSRTAIGGRLILMSVSLSHRSQFVRHCYDGTPRKDVTVNEQEWQLEQFERLRPHLQAVAYRMLGSVSEAEDALQEAWLRLSRADSDAVENLGGWPTTVVGRVCLDMLRARRARREDSAGTWLPEPIVSAAEGGEPANAAA